jgi:tripartite-type tricarboxylate transporter receptor subunit TctC
VTAVVSGETSVSFLPLATALPQARQGRLRALAVSTAKRVPSLPDYPTLAEAGVPGYEVDVWYGLFAPRGTPARVVAQIAANAGTVMSNPSMAERWQTLGIDPAGTRPAEFRQKFTVEIEKWGKVVKTARIELE